MEGSLEPEKSLNPEKFLIGFAGKDAIKESFDKRMQDREQMRTFCREFRSLRSMRIEGAGPVMKLLEMGGLSHNRVARETVSVMIDTMKRQIATLEQETLEALLDKCYSYLTVPQLAPIAVATLERLTHVDPDIWRQIVDNGVEDSPYIDLPLSIKKRIWICESSAFDHEIEQLIARVPEAPPSMTLEEFANRQDRSRQRAENASLTELMRMLQGMGEEPIAQVVEKMVQCAALEGVARKRDAIANLFHDFLIRLSTRTSSSLGVLRKMARFLDSDPPAEGNLDGQMLKEIREALSVSSSCGPVALLVASAYSRDFLSHQLVLYLLSRRGPIEDFQDPGVVAAAAAHVKADPWIPDLTYVNLCNIKAAVLLQGESLSEAEVEQPFNTLYPLLINEMHYDVAWLQDQFFNQNTHLPNDALIEVVQKGRLERRVMTTYCLQLCLLPNDVGLARFRLVLDNALRACDSNEEPREAALAYNLILKVVES